MKEQIKAFAARNRHIVLLAGLTLIFFIVGLIIKNGEYVMPEFDETRITIDVGKKLQYAADYADVTRVTLQPLPDVESLGAKKVKGSVFSASGENAAWGSYLLGVTTKATNCIVMETTSETIVFNYVDTEGTAAIYEAICESIAEGGYQPAFN